MPNASRTTEATHEKPINTTGYHRKTCVFERNGSARYPRWVIYAYQTVATAYRVLEIRHGNTDRLSNSGSKKYCDGDGQV
jgi:hypothetical protein